MLDGYRPLVELNDGEPSVEDVEWAKALIAAPITDETAAHLIQVVRGSDDGRAQMAAWALGFGVLPGSSRTELVEGLLLVVVDATRSAEVRAHAAEAVAEQLRFEDQDDRLQEVATARLLDTLDDASGMVRFWSAFALGQLHASVALPALHDLVGDQTVVPGWWTVGQEAADAIARIEGRTPAERTRTPAPG